MLPGKKEDHTLFIFLAMAAAREVAPTGSNAAPPAADEQNGKTLMDILHWLAIFFVMQNMAGLVMTKFSSTFRPPPPSHPSYSSDGGN